MDTQKKFPVNVGFRLENLNANPPKRSKLLVPSERNGPTVLPLSNTYLKACIYFLMKCEKIIILVGKMFVCGFGCLGFFSRFTFSASKFMNQK